MPSPLALKLAGMALNRSGLGRLIGRRHRGVGAIYVMHSLVEAPADHLNDHLHTSVRLLETALRRVRAAGVDVVTLDEALARLGQAAPRPFVAFTFDDGYRDNLTTALPLFQRYAMPFTVFVTTAFLDRSMNVWWAGLIEAIKRADEIALPGRDTRLSTRSLSEKRRAYRTIGRAVDAGHLSPEAVGEILKGQRVTLAEVLDAQALSETELKRLAEDPLVEIGAHTASHPALAGLSAESARSEMLGNRRHLQALTGRSVRHLAYPYGSPAACGPREFAIARELGFATASTTRMGCLFPQHAAHATALPRLRVFSASESVDLLEAGRQGALGALSTRFGDPVVTV